MILPTATGVPLASMAVALKLPTDGEVHPIMPVASNQKPNAGLIGAKEVGIQGRPSFGSDGRFILLNTAIHHNHSFSRGIFGREKAQKAQKPKGVLTGRSFCAFCAFLRRACLLCVRLRFLRAMSPYHNPRQCCYFEKNLNHGFHGSARISFSLSVLSAKSVVPLAWLRLRRAVSLRFNCSI
jgi:hypothetical protein